MSDDDEVAYLITLARSGDEPALASLFERYRERLRNMINLRMDARIRSRCDASDVLQDAYVELSRRMPEFVESEQLPFFLWLRRIAYGRLAKMHRRHLGTLMRTAEREVSMHLAAAPEVSSVFLASQLAGHCTSAHHNLVQVEVEIKLRNTIDAMDPNDREILVLRHFEELSTEETATLLGLSRSGVLKRYTRALRRLSEAIKGETDLNWTG